MIVLLIGQWLMGGHNAERVTIVYTHLTLVLPVIQIFRTFHKHVIFTIHKLF